VSTEREIAQGRWLGGTEGIGGKRPDVLFRSESRSVWVEVERSRKNQRDYAKMIQWLQLARRGKLRFGDLQSTENAGVGEILFICSDTFREKLIRDLRALTWTLDDVYAVVSFETSLYVVQDIYFT
jgi:hypothetical protein